MLDATHSYGRNLVGDTGDVSPHFFIRGDRICHVPPTFFSLGFVFGEVSKRKVMFVMFCVIDELFMLDGRPHIAMLMLKQSLMWYH